jgi:hypothetical protein
MWIKVQSDSHRKVSQMHNPKDGGSNPPPATMNATAEMQWRSPFQRHMTCHTESVPALQ